MFCHKPTLNISKQVHTDRTRTTLCIFDVFKYPPHDIWIEYSYLFAEQIEFVEWHHFVVTLEQDHFFVKVELLPDVQVVLKSDEFFEQ